MDETTPKFDCWAVLELFGHVRLAGRVTEASIGGCSFLRVDVPKEDGEIDFTRYFGNGAIYSMTPVTEEVARRVGNGSAQAPVKPWEMPRPALTSGGERDDDPRDDDDDHDDDEF
jgi:hypothetical protein